MKKVTAILLAVAALYMQGCAIEGSQRFTPTGFQISRTIGIGTGSTYQSAYYNSQRQSRYQQQQDYIIGPQYYRLSSPISSNYRSVRNYMNAPVVAETCNGSSVIIPRSWD